MCKYWKVAVGLINKLNLIFFLNLSTFMFRSKKGNVCFVMKFSFKLSYWTQVQVYLVYLYLVLGKSPKLSAQLKVAELIFSWATFWFFLAQLKKAELNLAGLIFSSVQNSPATFLFFSSSAKISSAKN